MSRRSKYSALNPSQGERGAFDDAVFICRN
jgi:hypothetical protein